MRAWLLQRGHLSLMPPLESPINGGYTNPHTANGITLALLMSRVVNASHHFATTLMADDDEVGVEVERIRLYNEVLINSARFCEVAIKQLLYCKRKYGKKPHLVSLVGTLAHPFGLCLEFEHCAMNHMDLVNKLRNSQAAHSEVQPLKIRSIAESKAQLHQNCQEILSDFIHMLSHLKGLEKKMLADLA